MAGRPSQRSTGWKRLGCAGASVVGVAAIGAVAMIGLPTFDLGGLLDFEVSIDAGPGKGTESARLPVEVVPRTGLIDGSVVTVTSAAFEPQSVVGVAVCLREADTESIGVDACDEVKGARYAVSTEGRLEATYPVPRVITVGGVSHDCAAPGGPGCLVVAASAGDYDESGGQPISFRTDLGAADMRPQTGRAGSDLLPVIPPEVGPVAAGVPVEVTASGFQPGEPVLMAHCTGFPREPVTSCRPTDQTAAMTAVMLRSMINVKDNADSTGTVTFTFAALAKIEPFLGGAEPTDCSDRGSECSFVIAAAADTKRSAVVPYSVVP